jgi:serine/threonine-protein kinase
VSKSPPPSRSSQGRLEAAGPRAFGPYLLEERLAVGGTAEVFLARPLHGERPAPQLVVKRLLASLRGDPTARAMFAEEARLHALFEHPNIVRCHGAGDVGGEPYLALELVAGADLHRVLRMAQARGRPIAPPVACHVARELLAALAVVHGAEGDRGPLGIVHRDVSPSNIYLSTTGDVKLGDFGIARQASSMTPGGTLGTAIRGKFAYLAPEQVASESIDHRADLFSIANVLAEMMLGRPLFPGAGQLAVLLSIRDVRIDALDVPSAIPLPLITILKRALSRRPEARFADASAFSTALAAFASTDRAAVRREIAQLVRWTRDTSLELRAVGRHPDQQPKHGSEIPVPASPASRGPRPSLRLDSELLGADLAETLPGGESEEVLEALRTESARTTVVNAPPPSRDPAAAEGAPSARGARSSPRAEGPFPSPDSAKATEPFAPPPSFVRRDTGEEIGPVSYAKLVELVVTGQLGGEDQVDFLGSGWASISEIDELARHLGPRSTATRQLVGPGAPDWHGFAAERYDEDVGGALEPGIAAALAFVAGRRATGVLLAQAGGRRKEIYFAEGRLHHVSSSEPTDLIGHWLVARGLLDQGELDFALAVLPRFGGRLGEALSGLGLLEPVALFHALGEQGRAKVAELFTWSDGELSFFSGAVPARVEFPLAIPIGPIVEAGIERLLDDDHAHARYDRWLGRRIGPTSVSVAIADAGFGANVERVLATVRAPLSVRTLLDRLVESGLDRASAIRATEAARVVGLLGWAL